MQEDDATNRPASNLRLLVLAFGFMIDAIRHQENSYSLLDWPAGDDCVDGSVISSMLCSGLAANLWIIMLARGLYPREKYSGRYRVGSYPSGYLSGR